MKNVQETLRLLRKQSNRPIDLLEATFTQLKSSGRKALIGYITAGFPSKKEFIKIVARLQASGVDILEIGVPFSDPVADGPTIQRSSQKALQNGVTLSWILDELLVMRTLRIPIVLMSYCNPIVALGLNSFFARARQAGVSGVIIPDLITEEGTAFEEAAQREGMGIIYLATPTTTPDRLLRIAQATRGFLYAVSLTGVTGARQALPSDVIQFLRRLRRQTRKPIALGFGISTPNQVKNLRGHVDGIIVGSALINHLEKSIPQAEHFVALLQKTLNPNGLKGVHYAS